MAIIGLPEFLGECKCGNLLVKELDGSYWTKYAPYVSESKGRNLSEKRCPGCGGDQTIPLGNFFYPTVSDVQSRQDVYV